MPEGPQKKFMIMRTKDFLYFILTIEVWPECLLGIIKIK
jgi:hypothetical protein